MAKLVHITTVPITLGFLRGQAAFMRQHGIVAEAVTSPGEGIAEFVESEAIRVHEIPMTRVISPLKDSLALVRLVRLFRALRPDILHAHTPKAGLLGTIASRIAGVKVTIYQLHGLPMVTATGLRRMFLLWSDRLACALADCVICVGQGVREEALEHGLCHPEKAKVFLGGSANGVDAMSRFNPADVSAGARAEIRSECGIPSEAFVVGYLGRVVGDKGLRDLVKAWERLSVNANLRLLIVGPFEPQDPLPPEIVAILTSDPKIILAGVRWDTPRWLAAMDLVVLPTYREGLPVVPLEAAAMGLPVVATKVRGCNEAVEDGVTGTLVDPRDPVGLAIAIERYVSDPDLCASHGAAGRRRMLEVFRPELIWEALLEEYQELLATKAA